VNQSFSIYSDTSSWDSNKWYHVAAVIHPIEGMLLFINGHKQSSQNTSFTTAIASNNYITTIGCWGDSYNRFYNGMLDELRFSSIERYDTDFTPPCPEFNPDINTIGLYHFDEKSGATANDVSSNAFNGSVYGSIFLAENVCSTTFTENVSFEQIQKVYPNPTTSLIHFNRNDFKTPNLYVEMYDAKLNNIFSRMPLRNDFIDLSHLSSGAYWYIISDDNKTILDKGTIIKE
jgi:hypothetical protein